MTDAHTITAAIGAGTVDRFHGVPHADHHCHRLRFDPEGRIQHDRFFCGGRWDAGLLAEMAAANDAG